MNIHVIPLNDHEMHIASINCHCNPLKDPESGSVIVHHALDGREKHERQGRPVSDHGWVNVGEEVKT